MFLRRNLILLCADMFVQHVDTEISEEDVEKIVSGSRAKTTLTVPHCQTYFSCSVNTFFVIM